MSRDELLETPFGDVIAKAGKSIVKNSDSWPRFDKRVDLWYDVVLKDAKLGRDHRVRVRVRFTAESLIFHDVDD